VPFGCEITQSPNPLITQSLYLSFSLSLILPINKGITAMTTTSPRMRQLVDWRAAFGSGLIAGAISLLVNFFITPIIIDGNA
jgi:hypothetical protein